eukprot:TRINITY_DN63790_c0_g1_i1.p2 TRINITY_DN63790_c0_g1~~TRINITY_DN63790_c0_g1_i1.p2  ORF type:complete len:134 (+),score=26.66 TRINITY_DN63790_c0_g1_i1:27-428(+)
MAAESSAAARHEGACKIAARRHASQSSCSSSSESKPWCFRPGSDEPLQGALRGISLLERPAMEAIPEDQLLAGASEDEPDDSASRQATPMYLPGCRDYTTLDHALQRLRCRHDRRNHIGAYAWVNSDLDRNMD